MHIHFEKSINAKTDCTILSMSWQGRVPEELPEDEGWKLNRNHYYQEGWLATGNIRGILGVTYTTSHWKKNTSDVPLRTNYNLRGHRAQVTLVQWNEPYQKLASCDSSGIIFVWIKFEGRWSIELINDRSTPVTHFSWSHDGRMALICYQDGFVLVGSVAGQRYWSTGLNLDGTITCGIWTPDDQQVYFGTSNGQIVVMDVHGTMLSQVQLPSDSPIASMSWSCEKFKMEESEEGEPSHYSNKRPFVLAVCFTTGGMYLMKNYDDIAPVYIFTGMHGLHMEWSNSGEFLAISGSQPVEVVNETGFRVKEYANYLHIYNPQGVRILNIVVPYTKSPITALTWGHNDKRIFAATGKVIHVGWVSKRIASLQLLCRLTIYKSLSTETCVSHLPLPLPVRALISSLHTQTILSILPNMKDLREFVSHPPPSNLRLHCTMIRHEEESNQSPGTVYTLYVEYLGGLIPILKGKRTSKIRPEFVIFDPQSYVSSEGGSFGIRVLCGEQTQQPCPTGTANVPQGNNHSTHGITLTSNSTASPSSAALGITNNPNVTTTTRESNVGGVGNLGLGAGGTNVSVRLGGQAASSAVISNNSMGGIAELHGYTDSSESEDVELCASPRLQRKRYRHRQRERERMREREREREWERTRSSVHLMPDPCSPHQLVYNDVLPETVRLVEVTSNIWGTKFKIHGLATAPENLGSVTYKTSLLHLQPRQMTLLITELRDDIFLSPDNIYSHADAEEEEDFSVIVGSDSTVHHHNISGGGGEVYHGHHIIYHPQGAGSPPVIPTNRCFLQPKSSTLNNSSNLTTHHHGQGPSNLVVNPCEAYSDDDQDEFPYVDLTTNPDMVHLRETLKQTIQYEYGAPTRFVSACPPTPAASTVVCQSCESSSGSGSIQSPRRSVAPSEDATASTALDLQERHNALQRVKSNLITRAQIENIDENNGTVPSGGVPTTTASPPSLHRTSGSIRSPTRICWSGHNITARQMENNKSGGENAPSVVAPVVQAPAIHVRRSMSASYLDSVERQGQLSLDIVNNEGNQNSPPKRLILVKKSNNLSAEGGQGESSDNSLPLNGKPRLRECGKSKSWDSCDISWWKSSYGSLKGEGGSYTSACPKCSFPSTTSKKLTPLAISEPFNKAPIIIPSTPPRTGGFHSFSNCSTSINRNENNRLPQQQSTASTSSSSSVNAHHHQRTCQSPLISSIEDQIERVETPMSPTPVRSSAIPQTPPTPAANHRRSLSLLTPLLRRRDLNSRNQNNDKTSTNSSSQTTTGMNPASSSFIPPGSPQHQPRSSPSTPAAQRKAKQSYLSSASSPFRQLFANSPLLSRRRNKNTQQPANRNIIDSSDDEGSHPEDIPGQSNSHTQTSRSSESHNHSSPRASIHSINTPFKDLETFQKHQLRQKLRKKKIHNVENCPFPRRREFIMHNKAPMWNENSQVYQLDFGGRVTQESAKNFQIEFRGKQVMQFGRIDGNAYTLDFQYPFSALQAFAVALCNVTQRLK